MGIFSNTSTFDGLIGEFFLLILNLESRFKMSPAMYMKKLTINHYFAVLDKATSQLLLEPDWNCILQICDSIRQEDVK